MTGRDDIALLKEWAEHRSEAAFRALVERYAPLVWGAAFRKTEDGGMAEEAAQQVFADLSRKAPVLAELRRPLAAWLHRSAVYEAVQVLRREIRHRQRMKSYAVTAPEPSAPDPWNEVRPHLDDAINSLGEADRRVLLLHWFEERTFAEVADQLGCSPAAAQRRGLRALDKLAASLQQRRAIVSAAVLAAGLTSFLTPAAPAGLAGAMCAAGTAAVSGTAASGVSLTFQKCLHLMASAKLTAAAIVIVCAALPSGIRLAVAHWPDAGRSVRAAGPQFAERQGTALPGADPALSAAGAAPGSLNLPAVKEALDRFLADPGNYEHELDLRRLMYSLSAAEIPLVLKLLTAVPGAKKEKLDEVCSALFGRWAELAPEEASRAAFAIRKGPFKYHPARAAFVTWAAADLDAAWAWLEKNATAPMDQSLLGDALALIAGDETPVNLPSSPVPADAAAAAHKPNAALMMARVDAMTDHAWRDQMRFHVLEAWVNTSWPQGAIEWASQFSDPQDRGKWIANAIELGGQRHPLAVLDSLQLIDDPDLRSETTYGILWNALLENPEDAFREIRRHEADLPSSAFRLAGEVFVQHDPAKAPDSAAGLPESQHRQEFIRGMLDGAGESDAAAVLPGLKLFSAEELTGSGGLEDFVAVVSRQNPQAAAAWIASLPPSSTVRVAAEAQFMRVTGRSAARDANPASK